MNTRYKYIPIEKRDSSHDDEFISFTYEKRIRPLSKNEDGTIDKYVEETFWKEEKGSWKEFIKSYDLGSVSQQVLDHIQKGTPLVTAHTLPAGDYTTIGKGAEIKREMAEKGITIEMVTQALQEMMEEKVQKQEKVQEKPQEEVK